MTSGLDGAGSAPFPGPLSAEFGRLVGLLDAGTPASSPHAAPHEAPHGAPHEALHEALHEAPHGADDATSSRAMPDDASIEPIDDLCQRLGLSGFERDVLLLCAGVELDADVAAALRRRAGPDAGAADPTFALALAVLPDPHWSALLPTAPLRRWRLIEVATGPALVASSLRIDERILHHLVGLDYLDERLATAVELADDLDELGPAHQTIARQMVAAWLAVDAGAARLPVLQLCGDDPAVCRAIALEACRLLDHAAILVHAHLLPGTTELAAFQRICERETLLTPSVLLLAADGVGSGAEADLERFLDRVNAPTIIMRARRLPPRERSLIAIDVGRSDPGEQAALWRRALGETAAAAAPVLPALAHQFNLRASTLRTAAAEATGAANLGKPLPEALWDSCREQARPRIDNILQRISPVAGWDDLVLPEAQTTTLRMVVEQIRHRPLVHGEWGFGARGERGLGVAVLFAGASGTGKTLAAEVLATELRLDLYRIDLSAVIDKYIGETEKNLQRAFDAVEAGGAILLFDEADALFGKRSEVKDSHDRHANIGVSYLLQRIEAYRGLAILTTNLKESIDQAFLRRLRFVVQFPYPGPAERRRIWSRAFPADTPRQGLDLDRLAQLNLAGGGIHNIALNAAFIAAAKGRAPTMADIGEAARREYAKLERTLTEAETRGWA